MKAKKGEIVIRYLEKQPKTPSLTLAKQIYGEHPNVWPSLEAVRNMVRYYKGRSGELNRKYCSDRRFMLDGNLAEPVEYELEPYVLPKNANNILIISDLHIPSHAPVAIEQALEYGYKNNINTVLLNGDIWDCYFGSRWFVDPSRRSAKEELYMIRDFLAWLRKILPDVFIYYKEGNHEERWKSYIARNAMALWEVNEFRLDILLQMPQNKINWIEDKRKIMAGKLPILHGHEFGRSVFSPVNPARGFYLRSKYSMLGGHCHQSSEHTERRLNDSIDSCWSVGCLCNLKPLWLPINKWNHGFAIVETEDDGNFNVHNKRIIKNKIC